MFDFTVSYAKKSMTLGLVVLVIGISVTSFLLLFPHTDTVIRNSVDVTITGIYSSDKFRAESGYSLDLDINSSGASTIHVIGQTVGEIFRVDGTTYKYNVSISSGDVYQVQVENKAGHYEYIIIWVPDENHIAGSFYLKRTAAYFFQLLPVGAILLAVGSLIVPITIYIEYNARQRAKLLYKCPRCGKEVNIGLEICPYCKLDLTKYWVRCKYCNKFYDSHLEKCPKCGAETEV